MCDHWMGRPSFIPTIDQAKPTIRRPSKAPIRMAPRFMVMMNTGTVTTSPGSV